MTVKKREQKRVEKIELRDLRERASVMWAKWREEFGIKKDRTREWFKDRTERAEPSQPEQVEPTPEPMQPPPLPNRRRKHPTSHDFNRAVPDHGDRGER